MPAEDIPGWTKGFEVGNTELCQLGLAYLVPGLKLLDALPCSGVATI